MLCLSLCDPADRSTAGLPVHPHLKSLLKLTSIESVMPSNHLILCRPLLLLPSIFPSIRVFSNELAFHIRWPKYLSFSISPSNEYSELISFRMDWSKGLSRVFSIVSKHQFFGTQPSLWFSSHLYMTTGKTSFDHTELCWQSDVSAFNM